MTRGTRPARPKVAHSPGHFWLLALAVAALMAIEVLVVVATQGSATTTDWWYPVPRLAMVLLTLVVVVVVRLPLRDRSGAGGRRRGLGLGHGLRLAWPAGLVAALALVAGLAGERGQFAGWAALVLFSLSMLSVGLFEEVLARGLVLGSLARAGGNTRSAMMRAAVVSSLIFGVVHVVNVAEQGWVATGVQVVYAALIGFFFAAVRIRSGSLVAVVVVHAIIDWSFYLPSDTFTSVAGSPGSGAGLAGILLVVGALLAGYGAWLLRRRRGEF